MRFSRVLIFSLAFLILTVPAFAQYGRSKYGTPNYGTFKYGKGEYGDQKDTQIIGPESGSRRVSTSGDVRVTTDADTRVIP